MADRSGYIGRAPADSAVTVARQTFSPTGVTTDFTFASGYVAGYFDIFLNGVKMIEGSDYTSTDGSTFSILNGGAENGDVIEAVAYKAFNAATIDSAPGNLSVGGNLTVTGSASFGSVAAGTSVSFATTAYALEGTPDISVRNVTGVAATFTGVVTLEDVTNIDSVGIVTARAGIRVTGGVIEAQAGENKIPSLYSNMGSLPSAGSYHGMFAHVHATGRGYFAHAGNWYELVNKELNGVVGTGTEHYNVGIVTARSGLNVIGGGATITGITTSLSGVNIVGGGLTVTGVSTFFDTVRVGSAITLGASSGIVTATTFSGDVTGDVSGTSTGLSGTPNITVGSVVGSALTITGITSIASVGIGTTNPAVGLHLYDKGLRIDDGNITMQSTAPQIFLKEYGSTYGDQNWSIVRDADSFSIRWKNATPYAFRSTVDSNGDVENVFLRGSKVEVNSSGALITGVTTCNVGSASTGFSVVGNTSSLDIANHSAGDYAINNPTLNHRVILFDGTSGVELRYGNDATKTFEVDSGGVKSPFIANTTAGSGTALVISSNLIKPQSSTRRLKNNIRNYVGAGLSRIEQMVPRTWEDFSSGDTYSGFVAEELHDIGFESALTYREYQGGSEIGIGDTYGSMYGNGSTPVTKDGVDLDDEVLVVDNFDDRVILAEVVIALKELKAENDSLKSRIAALESS